MRDQNPRRSEVFLDPETAPAGHTYDMKTYDEKAATVLRGWTEQEYRKTVGARPRGKVTEVNEFDPRGPHRWFLEALAEASLIIALRQMAET